MRTLALLATTAVCAAPISAQALQESFDYSTTGNFPPTGWTETNAGAAAIWTEALNTLNTFPTFLGTDAAAHDYQAFGGMIVCDDNLFSPVMDLSTYSSPELTFQSELGWPTFLTNGASNIDVTVDGGLTWSNVWMETGTAAALTSESVDLTAVAGSQAAVQLRFNYQGLDAHLWVVDDVVVDHSSAIGPGLTVSGSCPGVVSGDATGMTPAAPVFFVYGQAGSFTAPSGPCAGLTVALNSPTIVSSVIADTAGMASISGSAPLSACGLIYLVAVDAATCVATGPVAL